MKQVSDNAFRLNLPRYMNICSIVNVENLKLFASSMLTEDEAGLDQILSSLDDLAPPTIEKIKEEYIL